jgi:autotransporter-associated beta strand protein
MLMHSFDRGSRSMRLTVFAARTRRCFHQTHTPHHTAILSGIFAVSLAAQPVVAQVLINGVSSATLGTGTLNVTDNTVLTTPSFSPVTFANPVNINFKPFPFGHALTVVNQAPATITMSGAISGGGSIKVEGGGQVNLTGVNSFTGGVSIESGTLGIGSNSALGIGNIGISPTATLLALQNIAVLNQIDVINFGYNNTDTVIFDTNGFKVNITKPITLISDYFFGAFPGEQQGITKKALGHYF